LSLLASQHPNRHQPEALEIERNLAATSRQVVQLEQLAQVPLNQATACHLKVAINYDLLHFYYSYDAQNWHEIGPYLDATRLSDEYCQEGWFTGTFIGLCAQDLSGQHLAADFDYFSYQEFSETHWSHNEALTMTAGS
jgi:beta-xylosidase